MPRHSKPGITRDQRISSEGLERLERQLSAGARVSAPVLAQWIKRYGKPARDLIERYCRSAGTVEDNSDG